MQFSLCTGGAFVNAAIALGNIVAAHDATPDSVPMTFANIGYLTCQASGKSSDENISHRQPSGCQNASTCLSREHTRIRDQQFTQIFARDSIAAASFLPFSYAELPIKQPEYALTRPPGQLAFQGLPSTVKLE